MQLAAEALDTLLSDLLTLSAQLYETQTPDVQDMGFQIALISIAWGVLSSSVSAAMTWFLLPGMVPIITGVLIGSLLGYFKLKHMQQERIYQKDIEHWEQCRVPLQGVRTYIQRLIKHIQKVEGNAMADSIVSRVNDRVNAQFLELSGRLTQAVEGKSQD